MRIFTRAIFHVTADNTQTCTGAVFLASCHCFLHSSVVPELLGEKSLLPKLLTVKIDKDATKTSSTCWLSLFALSDTMQFARHMFIPFGTSKSRFLNQIFLPLLTQNRYFVSTLRDCEIECSSSEEEEMTEIVRQLHNVRFLEELSLADPDEKNMLPLVKGFRNLRSLTLRRTPRTSDYSTITSQGLNDFSQENGYFTMKTVKSLKLDACPSPGKFFSVFPNLVKIELDWMKDALDVILLVRGAPQLEEIDIRNCLIAQCDADDESSTFDAVSDLQFLRVLRVKSCHFISSLKFLSSSSFSENLKVCEIDSTKFYDKSDFVESAQCLADLCRLQVLNLAQASKFDDECIQHICNLPELTELTLNSTGITFNGLRLLEKLPEKKLQVLRISRCCRRKYGGDDENVLLQDGEGNLNDSPVLSRLFETSFGGLRTLDIMSCDLVDADLERIHILKDTLQELNLGQNCALSHNAVSRQVSQLVNLTSLRLSSLSTIIDLKFLAGLKRLETLILICCDSLTDESFELFNDEISPSAVASSSSSSSSSFLPNLSFLSFAFCPELTTATFMHLSKSKTLPVTLTKLQAFCREDKRRVTPELLNHLIALRNVEVMWASKMFGTETKNFLKSKMKNLQVFL